MLFRLALPDSPERRPDVAFVSYQRWPHSRKIPRTPAWEVTPDLAVEVVSPSNEAGKVLAKVREYFRAGVQVVWVVWPATEEVYVYESPTRIRVLERTDELEGGTLLPGFRLPVATLFEEDAAAETKNGQ